MNDSPSLFERIYAATFVAACVAYVALIPCAVVFSVIVVRNGAL